MSKDYRSKWCYHSFGKKGVNIFFFLHFTAANIKIFQGRNPKKKKIVTLFKREALDEIILLNLLIRKSLSCILWSCIFSVKLNENLFSLNKKCMCTKVQQMLLSLVGIVKICIIWMHRKITLYSIFEFVVVVVFTLL